MDDADVYVTCGPFQYSMTRSVASHLDISATSRSHMEETKVEREAEVERRALVRASACSALHGLGLSGLTRRVTLTRY